MCGTTAFNSDIIFKKVFLLIYRSTLIQKVVHRNHNTSGLHTRLQGEELIIKICGVFQSRRLNAPNTQTVLAEFFSSCLRPCDEFVYSKLDIKDALPSSSRDNNSTCWAPKLCSHWRTSTINNGWMDEVLHQETFSSQSESTVHVQGYKSDYKHLLFVKKNK